MTSSTPRRVLLVAVLVAANVVLGRARRNLVQEGSELRAEASELEERARGDRDRRERERGLLELGRRAAGLGLDETVGIARLRERLLQAEEGLALERLSLDFRQDDAARGGLRGLRLTGSFVAKYRSLRDYLGRVEAMKLPLVPEEMTFRPDGDGRTRLSVRWRARWPSSTGVEATGSTATPEQVSRLVAWLDRVPSPPPRRDPFAPPERAPDASRPPDAEEEARTSVEARTSESERPPSREPAPEPGPTLAGFVLARPEVEPDVARRVLAALRYEGEMWLVGAGDRIGAFVVERIDPRESVTLRNAGSGETKTLRLE